MATTRTPRYEREYAREGGYDRGSDWRSTGWGPVLSGAAAAFLTFISFSALWLALSATGADWVANNLEWFELATALGSALVAGVVTGMLQPDDRMAGAMRGLAAWGLVLVAGLIVGVPASAAIVSGATGLALQQVTTGGDVAQALSQVGSELWAAFVIFGGGGLIAAMTAGASAIKGHTTGRHREERVIHLDEEERGRPTAQTSPERTARTERPVETDRTVTSERR